MKNDLLLTCSEHLRALINRFNECQKQQLHNADAASRLADLKSIAEGAHFINRSLNDLFLSGEAKEDDIREVIEVANEAGRLAIRARKARMQ